MVTMTMPRAMGLDSTTSASIIHRKEQEKSRDTDKEENPHRPQVSHLWKHIDNKFI